MKNISEFRIVYMGTPEISAQVFSKLIDFGFNFVGLIAQEDQPVGRKAIIEDVPTKKVAKEHNIPVFQPHRIRNDYQFLIDLKPDLILTMAYGQIVPQAVLDIPKLGCLNLHGSILPKYRGAAPIQYALLNGEKETGVTLMEMVDKMDAGKIFAISKCCIDDNDNYTSLCDKIVECAVDVSIKNLEAYLNGNLKGVEQDESLVTFSQKIKPEQEKLSFDYSCEEFINVVRGLSYTPGAYIYVDNKKLKIFKCHKVCSCVNTLGLVNITKTITLNLKDGVIEIDELQMEGKKKMDGKSFANGSKFLNGLIAE